MPAASPKNHGFTLMELVMIILLIGIISVAAVAKWPTGMADGAALRELKRGIRYAQHIAMTRYSNDASAWGIFISSNSYTVRPQNESCNATCSDCSASQDFCHRTLLDRSTDIITITDSSIWFNGLGEPLSGAVFPQTISVGSESLTVCPQTGYVMEGNTCP